MIFVKKRNTYWIRSKSKERFAVNLTLTLSIAILNLYYYFVFKMDNLTQTAELVLMIII